MTKEFNLNKKIADSGIQAFNCIKDKIGPEYARVISWTLTKLKLLEEQGAEILKADYDYINHPLHYTNGKKECIDEMIELFGKDNVAMYCDITAYKYQYRQGKKPNTPAEQDKQKAEWYLKKAKELRDYDERGNEEHNTSFNGCVS